MIDDPALRALSDELNAALLADDCLGFDRRAEARHAVLSHPDYRERWECSDRLIAAVDRYTAARRARPWTIPDHVLRAMRDDCETGA